jgi:hypothetical protein
MFPVSQDKSSAQRESSPATPVIALLQQIAAQRASTRNCSIELQIAMRLAFSIEQLAAETSLSRTAIYEEIAQRRLRVSKCGSRSIVTLPNALEWLLSLPLLEPSEKTVGK